jgi:uncharacterized protein (DUF1778 family)
MAETLTIRLELRDRKILETAARQHGVGLSAFVRDIAEAEARRLRNAEIRAEGEKVVSYLLAHPEARAEIELYGTPIDEEE